MIYHDGCILLHQTRTQGRSQLAPLAPPPLDDSPIPPQLVLTADIYEEEDLVPNTHSLYMGTTHSEDDMIYLLNEADK